MMRTLARKLGDHLRRELLAERDQQRVLALAARHEFVRAHDVIVFVEVHIVIAPRTFDRRRAQHAGYQEFGFLHVSGSLRGMGLAGWGTGDSRPVGCRLSAPVATDTKR